MFSEFSCFGFGGYCSWLACCLLGGLYFVCVVLGFVCVRFGLFVVGFVWLIGLVIAVGFIVWFIMVCLLVADF